MVTPARVERATYRLGGGCSILLSYGASQTKKSNQLDEKAGPVKTGQLRQHNNPSHV